MDVHEIIKQTLLKVQLGVEKNFPEIQRYQFINTLDNDGYIVVDMDVGTVAKITCTKRPEQSFLALRAEMHPENEESDEQLEDIGSDAAKDIGGNVSMTVYDGILAIIKNVSLETENNIDLERMVFNEVMSFCKIISDISGNFTEDAMDKIPSMGFDTADAQQEDPFGYDAISLSQNENIESVTDTQEGSAPEVTVPGSDTISEQSLMADIEDPYDDQENKALPISDPKMVEENNETIADTEGSASNVDQEDEKAQEKDRYLSKKSKHKKKNPFDKRKKGPFSVSPQKTDDVKNDSFEKDKDDESHFNPNVDLDRMLKDLESEEPIVISSEEELMKQIADTVDAAVDTAHIDVLKVPDDFSGNDKYGLVTRTRDFKTSANKILDEIHEILVSVYKPAYDLTQELYARDSALVLKEKQLDQSQSNILEFQKKLDDRESQIISQQQTLLQKRAEFNKFKENTDAVLQDYDSKCQYVSELEKRTQQLQQDLTSEREKSGQIQKKLDALLADGTSDTVSRAYADALMSANRDLRKKSEQLIERNEKYAEVVDTYKQYQKLWQEKTAGYEDRIDEITKASANAAASAKRDIENYRSRVRELESRVATQKKVLDEQARIGEENKVLKADVENAKLTEAQLKADMYELKLQIESSEQRIKTLEGELNEKSDPESSKTEIAYASGAADKTPMPETPAEASTVKTGSDEDINYRAQQIIERFKVIGISLEPEPSSEFMLKGERNLCEIFVNVGISMAFVGKSVKKAYRRYGERISSLNTMDICRSFCIDNSGINCRIMFRQPDEAALEIDNAIQVMDEFN